MVSIEKIKGSCFVTISDKDDNTMSCFGDWESENNNILDCIKVPSLVKTKSWNDKEPVSRKMLKKLYNFVNINRTN